MLRDWTIYTPVTTGTYSGTRTLSLSSLPATALKITFRNRAADEARITFETASPAYDPTSIWQHLKFGREYLLACPWKGQGIQDRPFFYGTLEKLVCKDSGRGGSVELVLLGGWHFLTRYIYATDNGHGQITTHVTIGGTNYSATNQICKILYYAAGLSQLVEKCRIRYNVQDIFGIRTYVDVSDKKIPAADHRDITCAEAIDAVLAFFPDAHAWTEFDWVSTGASLANNDFPFPQILVGRIHDDTDVQLSKDGTFDGADLVSSTISKGPNPPYPGVVLGQERANGTLVWGEGVGNAKLPGGMQYTLEYDSGFSLTTDALSQLAVDLYQGLQHDRPEGTLVLVGSEAPGLYTLRPNRRIWLDAARVASPIQSVEFDIGQGQTTVTFGPPSHLGTQDLVSLARANRTRNA